MPQAESLPNGHQRPGLMGNKESVQNLGDDVPRPLPVTMNGGRHLSP